MTAISVIIPTLDEADTIRQLTSRVHEVLVRSKIHHEIIISDNGSHDGTDTIVSQLSREYPVRLLKSGSRKGKAYALLEGFKSARYPVLCMIDADLQYAPEAIPQLLEKLTGEVGIVIGDRSDTAIEPKRKFLMNMYRKLFGNYLHGFHQDVMSGLKIIRKEVIERITLHPYPWSFDIELLVKARNAGYRIVSVPISFERRRMGRSKIKLLPASFQMAGHALNLAMSNPDVVPFHPEQEKRKGKGFNYEGLEYIHHSDLPHHETAFFRLSLPQVFFLSFLFGVAIVGILMDWHATTVVILAVLTVLYFVDLLFNLFLIYRSFSKPPESV
ncbi:MAG: glycosyltransferase, partial [Candidatus Roizmanbacteria bacterium]|nr:glycosyltransferase [Candidatus Roizmanbacteria bacterium]